MSAAPRVLFATPELAPWAKAGGLGEVARDLPRALAAAGADVRVLVPAYPAVRAAFPAAREIAPLDAPGGRLAPARLLEAAGSPPVYLLACEAYYARAGGPYGDADGADWPDNDMRFGLLSRAAAILGSAASPLAWRPELVHCNDWQTGLEDQFDVRRHRFATRLEAADSYDELQFDQSGSRLYTAARLLKERFRDRPIAGVLLFTEHRAHVLGALVFLPLLLCPLMHLFMHGGHGHGGSDGKRQQPPGTDSGSHH